MAGGGIKINNTTITGGADGATFIPMVSSDGVLSWTNNKNYPNPTPVNIKGQQGIQGEKGEKGDKGDKGDTVVVYRHHIGVEHSTSNAPYFNISFDVYSHNETNMGGAGLSLIVGKSFTCNGYIKTAEGLSYSVSRINVVANSVFILTCYNETNTNATSSFTATNPVVTDLVETI